MVQYAQLSAVRATVRSWFRVALAIGAIPFLVTYIVPAGGCLLELIFDFEKTTCIDGLRGYTFYGLVPSILGVVFLGIPLFFFALRIGATRLWQFVLLSAFAGGVAVGVLGTLIRDLSIPGMLMIVVPLCAIAGMMAWLLGIYGNLRV